MCFLCVDGGGKLLEAVGLGGGIGTSLPMLGEQSTIHGSTFPATVHAQVAL